jgi:hypothetical protein
VRLPLLFSFFLSFFLSFVLPSVQPSGKKEGSSREREQLPFFVSDHASFLLSFFVNPFNPAAAPAGCCHVRFKQSIVGRVVGLGRRRRRRRVLPFVCNFLLWSSRSRLIIYSRQIQIKQKKFSDWPGDPSCDVDGPDIGNADSVVGGAIPIEN